LLSRCDWGSYRDHMDCIDALCRCAPVPSARLRPVQLAR
jgi:hypothetical protein